MTISAANYAMLLRLRIGGKTFETTDRVLSEELTTGKEAAADSGKVIKRLLGGKCKLLQEIQKIAANTRLGLANRTLPYCGIGMTIVSVDSWESTMTWLKQQKALYDEALEKFLEAFPTLVEDAKKSLNKMITGNEHYPSVDELRRKFAFSFHLEPFPDVNLFDKVLNLQGQEEELKQEMAAQMNSMLEEAEDSLKDRIRKRAQLVYDKVSSSDQKRIRYEQIFKKTTEVMDIVQGLNITKSSHIHDWANRMKSIVDHDSEVVRKDPVLRNAMESDLYTLLNELGNVQDDDSQNEVENLSEEEESSSEDNYDDALSRLLS